MRYTSPIFLLSSFLFVLNQLVERLGIHIPWVHAYLDDILCPSIVLGLTLFIQQQLTFRRASYVFSVRLLVGFVIWYSILFEVIFPMKDPRHFSDPWDIAAYAAGTLLFYKFGNRPAEGLIFFRRVARN